MLAKWIYKSNYCLGPLPLQLIREKASPAIRYRFSGHQTFPLRVAWLPKVIRELAAGADPLSNLDEGITRLGLGKNMVEALRCWLEAFQVGKRIDDRWQLSPVASAIFAPDDGYDPYLEDVGTCWMLHWLISTNTAAPFFAWECLFNRWNAHEFSASSVLEAFRRESDSTIAPASDVTLKQHWEVFIHSYKPPRGHRGEDHLDSALSVLGIIREAGERQGPAGKWETVYSFDTGFRTGISQQLFTFFLHDWWNRSIPHESTAQISDVVAGPNAPGRLLKMQEIEIVERLEEIAKQKRPDFQIVESMNMRRIERLRDDDGLHYIKAAYLEPRFM